MNTGKELRILSNDLDAPAQEIADLYKRRWAIELFFGWIKQTLRIRTFIGYTEPSWSPSLHLPSGSPQNTESSHPGNFFV